MSNSSDDEDGSDVAGKSSSLKNQKDGSSFREISKRRNRSEDKFNSRLGSQERVTSRSDNF